MNNLNSSRKPAARTRSGNFLDLLLPAALIPALLMLFLAGGATASAQVVTNSADSGPGTLRSAITNAANGAVITFDPSLSGATIRLASTLTINANLTIDASALPGGLQINGNFAVQIFNVTSNITVFLSSLTITNGYSTNNGGGIYNNGGTLTLTNCILSGNSATFFGGGIYNTYNTYYTYPATLTLNQCTLSGNSAPDGGGIFNDGLLTMNQCTLSENIEKNDLGGGIYNNVGEATLNQCTLSGNIAKSGDGIYNAYGGMMLNQCTLSGNSASGYGGGNSGGGGIYNEYGTMTLNQCTLSGNSVEFYDGGGIYNHGLLTLNQCTLSGNSAGYGGGISNDNKGTLTMNQCTLSGNSAGYGGGIYNYGTLAITNTIVAGNNGSLGADIYTSGTIIYGHSNFVQSYYYGSSYITGPAPNLAPLGNYGGPTQTMPPLPGSPAIGAGSVADNISQRGYIFSTDQRGYSRTQNGLIDLGAVELQSPAANPPVLENITVPAGGGNGLQFTFTNAPAADFTVLTATNVSLALTNWTVLGEVQQVAPGQYQFTDPQAATNTVRFYRVRSP